MGADSGVHYLLGFLLIERCRADMLRTAGRIFRFKIIEVSFRNNLDDRQSERIPVSQHGNRELGTLNILLNDNKLVNFEHTLDGISNSFFAFHDVNAQSAAFGSRFHDTGSAHSQCKLLNGISLSLLEVLIGSGSNAFALVKKLGLGLVHRRCA